MSVASAVAAVVACAMPAVSAGALTPSPDPLTGSSFQGADGNQATRAASPTGMCSRRAVGSVHNPDPNAQDTAFAGGTKEGDPAHWDSTRRRVA